MLYNVEVQGALVWIEWTPNKAKAMGELMAWRRVEELAGPLGARVKEMNMGRKKQLATGIKKAFEEKMKSLTPSERAEIKRVMSLGTTKRDWRELCNPELISIVHNLVAEYGLPYRITERLMQLVPEGKTISTQDLLNMPEAQKILEEYLRH